MRFLIVGDGEAESAWAETLDADTDHEGLTAWPGLPDDVEASPKDLDDALAWRGVEAVIVGGPIALRDEALRKAAAAGLHAISLHPPGPNADAYYQVALSREETGAVVVPDLPLRLHPGLGEVREAIEAGTLGLPVDLTIEVATGPGEGDLVVEVFSRVADLVRSLLGEIGTISAFGEPPGLAPTRRLTVQLRAGDDRRAEVRIVRGEGSKPTRLTLNGRSGSISAELPEVDRSDAEGRSALLGAFTSAVAGRPASPGLIDGTRAMELAEGVARSLRRGRTIDLHYEEVSEDGNFKTVMTSLGCMILMSVLVALPLALAGPVLGMGWLIYIAYAIPPVLIVFGLMQLLRFGVKRPGEGGG